MSQAKAVKSTPVPAALSNPRSQVFLFVAVVLFVGWTAFVAYLMLTTVNPIVVSRPQVYIAPIVVEAQVPDGQELARKVTVTRVYRGQRQLGIPETEEQPQNLVIEVNNLGEARGWRGAGEYILALQPYERKFDLVPIPHSPGFPPSSRHLQRALPAIYPVTPSTQAQTQEALLLSEGGR